MARPGTTTHHVRQRTDTGVRQPHRVRMLELSLVLITILAATLAVLAMTDSMSAYAVGRFLRATLARLARLWPYRR